MALAAGILILLLPRCGATPTATRSLVEARCAGCHKPVEPGMLAKADWARVMEWMKFVIPEMSGVRYPEEEMAALLRYHQERSPERLERLPPDPEGSPLRFEAQTLPVPDTLTAGERPVILNVSLSDLDRDGRPEILVCDGLRGTVSVIHRTWGPWMETALAPVGIAARAAVTDWNADGHADLAVAILGSLHPTDEPVGRVTLLTNDGAQRFSPRVILEGVGRVADVRPGDFDGDGDTDFVVAVFGHIKRGAIGWLEQRPEGRFVFHTIREGPGAIHVPTCDLDGDGRVDFVALISQHVEQVVAFLNEGHGRFDPRILFEAGTPLFGSSGIELVDLDRDGDLDVLYTNGDAFDLPDPDRETYLRPYHGVLWLENLGGLRFERRDLIRFYGAYRATAADLDGDGDLDIVASSLHNDWDDPSRKSLIWLENDGRQRFTAHAIANAPTELATAEAADLDGDGRPDIVAGGIHLPPTTGRIGRITLWRNAGPAKKR